MNSVRKFLRDDDGAAGVEYGLLVAAIAAAMVVLVFAVGTGVEEAFRTVCTAMKAKIPAMDVCPA